MNEDSARLNALTNAYPRLFSQPLPLGLETGDGWIDIVKRLCERIDTILKDAPAATFEVQQIKEKFGGLRFYYRVEHADKDIEDAIQDAIQTAELASTCCCERCGRPATLIDRKGWLKTRCYDCETL